MMGMLGGDKIVRSAHGQVSPDHTGFQERFRGNGGILGPESDNS